MKGNFIPVLPQRNLPHYRLPRTPPSGTALPLSPIHLFALLLSLYLTCLSCMPCADDVAVCVARAH